MKQEKMNQAALELFFDHEVYAAQNLLRKNAEENPCWMTYQNYGVFCGEEGRIRKNQLGRSANRTAVRYLKKAVREKPHFLTYTAWGTFYYKNKEYRHAAEQYALAYQWKADWRAAHNCGVCWFLAKNYDYAALWFTRALEYAPEEAASDTKTALAYAHFWSQNPCGKELCQQLCQALQLDAWDAFILSALCGKPEAAVKYAEEAWSGCCFGNGEMAILFDCLDKLGDSETMSNYYRKQMEVYDAFTHCSMEREKRLLRRMYRFRRVRRSLAEAFRPNPEHLSICNYAGCPIHSNPID